MCFQLEFEKMKMLVLDEADELLEDDFARELRKITKLPGWPKVFPLAITA
jgi:superfamily II DNA/RNA helicase